MDLSLKIDTVESINTEKFNRIYFKTQHMTTKGKEFSDDLLNANFDKLLKRFHDLLTLDKEAMLKGMKELSKEAINTNALAGHQRSAIVGRCKNVLDGTYGNTKTSTQMNYGSSPAK